MNHTSIQSFSDELSKIAAARWKTVLRMGELGADDISKLERTGILNRAKEVAGLARGNEALSKELQGIGAKFYNSARDMIKDDLIRIAKGKEYDHIIPALVKAHGIKTTGGSMVHVTPKGELSVVLSKRLLRQPVKKLDDLSQKAHHELMKRHEIDEVKALLAQAKKGQTLGNRFMTFRPPKGIRERIDVASSDATRSMIERASRSRHKALKDFAYGADVGSAASKGIPVSQIPKGMQPSGQHFSPSVILRENKNVATLPTNVREAMEPLRIGENLALARQGLRYGQVPPKRELKRTIKAMETPVYLGP